MNNYLDIHSHILPGVDDGAVDIEMSLTLLEMMKAQGVTHVIATPHFYPNTDNSEDFVKITREKFSELNYTAKIRNLPEIFWGCELRYFNGISKSRSIKQFTAGGTNFLLLELPYGEPITKSVLQDITDISEQMGIMPILAHIERYYKLPGYKKLLNLISNGYARGQINAAAVIGKDEGRYCKKLIKGGYVSFLASDAHSPHRRPPLIKKALDCISENLGRSAANRLIINSNKLLEEIEECAQTV